MQRCVSFTVPRTRAEASRLIDELRRRPVDSAADRRRDMRAVQDAMATGRGDAARIREEIEVNGYGASATWKGGRSRAPAPARGSSWAATRSAPASG